MSTSSMFVSSPRMMALARGISLRQPTRRFLSGTAKEEDAAQKAAFHFYASRKKPSLWTRIFGKSKTPKAAAPRIDSRQRNVNTAWYAFAVAVGALGASYAAVPLYKVFCQTTGFGGTTQRVITAESAESMSTLENYLQRGIAAILPEGTAARVHTWTDQDAVDRLKMLKPVKDAELITIRFDTTVTDVMPWTFEPVQLDVRVVPGETALSFFRVTNHSDKAITGVATYNVHPSRVGLYFQKIQCFCFEEQRLLPGEVSEIVAFSVPIVNVCVLYLCLQSIRCCRRSICPSFSLSIPNF
jgi:cytochrome c oxidase assembly protein subunit 11